ncbi:MAG: glycosyltransferase family 4 protein [Bacteroidetes bacterium]|nr:glycosyltransferase family 4 protein [Bacteroidota bacterium]
MATIISIISYPFLPAKSGGQKGVALFNKYFSRYHKLICVTTKKNNPLIAEGYEVQNILSDSAIRYINIFYFFKLRKIIRQNNATHILLEHPYYGWLGVLLRKFCRVKLVVHSHNIESLRWKSLGKWWWKILWYYERFTHRNADYNFFIHENDKRYATDVFGIHGDKCIIVTYGIEWNNIPSKEDVISARQQLRNLHSISVGEKILLFNGAFNYKPNLDALKKIFDIINPVLQQKNNFRYRILICGIGIPEEIMQSSYPNITIVGFVDDVSLYFKGTDVFLNPVTEGGGIKTKLVEALGYNANAVSTENGAIGIDTGYCNGKLMVSENEDWQMFADLIVKASTYTADITTTYFEHFFWGNTTKKAAAFIAESDYNAL